MDVPTPTDSFLFGRFRLDAMRGLLRRDDAGDLVPVSLGSRALAVLRVLIERHGDLISKDEIMAAVWPNTAVEEANLTMQISTLRRVLDDGSETGGCIRTVSGRGYRFVLPVIRQEAGSSAARQPALDPNGPADFAALSRLRPRAWRRLEAGAGAVMIATIAALVIIVGWHGGWFAGGPRSPLASAAALQQVHDRRQSVIVLPFDNSSGDAAQDDLAAALTRDLTDRIILAGDGPVVPAATATVYRGAPVDLQAVGSRFDVHFALLGNARRQMGRVTVSASVYEIADGQPIWSRQFDLPDDPGVLTTIVQRIYESYWQVSVDEEAHHALRDRSDRLDKRDLMNAALSTRLSALTKEHYLEKIALVDRVLAIDPNDFQGLERQARFHVEFVLQGYSSDPAVDLAIAEKASDRLSMIDPNHLLALRARANVLRARGDWIGAEAVERRTIGLQPTEAMRHFELGVILMAEGRHQEALQSFERAKRFAGGSDSVYLFDANIALAYLAIGQFAEAMAMARVSISEFPPVIGRSAELPWLALIAATSDTGQNDEARADLQKFLAVPRSWHGMSQIQQTAVFVANQNLLNGLRNTGMPAK